MLNKNDDMIAIMEQDLIEKIQVAINCNPDLRMFVHGVFNIDDLERLMVDDLSGGIGVGVAFVGAAGTDEKAPGSSAKQVAFSFSVILAVPHGDAVHERHNATKLLTVLRRAIIGKRIANDPVQRTWNYLNERPEPSASTANMLYYAQLWQVTMPVIGSVA